LKSQNKGRNNTTTENPNNSRAPTQKRSKRDHPQQGKTKTTSETREKANRKQNIKNRDNNTLS